MKGFDANLEILKEDEDDIKIAIVSTQWNEKITSLMVNSARKTLLGVGMKKENIEQYIVPGSIELPFVCKQIAKNRDVDAIIVIGCIIQGETRHFDFVAKSVTEGITQLNLNYNIPFVFGVLTTDNKEQALERASVEKQNKGKEFAISAIKMIEINRKF